MTYDLDWTSSTEPAGGPGELPGKTHITLPDKTINDTATSLTLFGKGSPNYGEKQQENFLRILENFASETPPLIPTIGQLWWKVYPPGDIRNPILMVCKEILPTIVWVPVGNPMLKIAFNYEYNQMVDLFKKIVGDSIAGTNCSDTFGWGQTALAASVTKLYLPAQPVQNSDWVFLLNKWKQIAPLVGVDPGLFDSDGFIIEDHFHIEEGPPLGLPGEGKGIATIISEYENAKRGANDIFANRSNFTTNNFELLTYTPINRTTYWENTISRFVTFTWLSEAALLQYFTTGGNLKIIPSLNSPINDSITNMWVRLFDGLGGGIIIKGCGTNDQAGNPNFSTHTSIFELDNSFKMLYKANEHEVFGGLNAYDGGGAAGLAIIQHNHSVNPNEPGFTYNQSPIPGQPTSDFGTDADLGWGDITVYGRRVSPVTIEIKIEFNNERNSEVKGLLQIDLESRKLGATVNGIALSPVPAHPNLDTFDLPGVPFITGTPTVGNILTINIGLTNLGAPNISGTPTVGNPLTVTPGTWRDQ